MTMKIAMITPMPPMVNGIADHVVEFLDELARRVELSVFAINNDAAVDYSFPVRPLAEFELNTASVDYSAVFVQMGNDPRMAPGLSFVCLPNSILVLHDLNLACLYGGLYLNKKGGVRSFFKALLTEEGPAGYLKAVWHFLLTRRCPEMTDYNMIRGIVRRAGGVIVHNNSAAKIIRNYSRRVSVVPICVKPVDNTNDDSKAEARRKLGIPDSSFVVASFGGVHERKRIDAVTDIVKDIRSQCPDLVYAIVGGYDDSWRATHPFLENDCFRLTGRVGMEEFYDYINACDLCINLRNPWTGEQSGPLLRVMSAARPVVVSDVGVFAELPDETVFKVPLDYGEESRAIRDVIRASINDKSILSRKGLAACEYIMRNHLPVHAAEGYISSLKRIFDLKNSNS